MASSSPVAPAAKDDGQKPPTGEPPKPASTSDNAEETPSNDKPAKAAPSLADTFKLHASKGDATGSEISKWCKDAGVVGKTCDAGHVDISFTKAKAKGAKNMKFTEMEAFINELAVKYKTDHKLASDDAAKQQITEKLAKTKPKTHGTTKVSQTGGVGRMTDTKNYTGSHKERFDETGKGKGKEGRTDAAANTGYVGAYKEAGTYDAKKKPAAAAAPAKKK